MIATDSMEGTEFPTCPSIINVDNPGVGDEYW